jgi:hypothetical protein
MKLRISKTLRFWVECDYQRRKRVRAGWTRSKLLAEILREYEEAGEAMPHVNPRDQIAWEASPRMVGRLADAEQEARDDSEHDLT